MNKKLLSLVSSNFILYIHISIAMVRKYFLVLFLLGCTFAIAQSSNEYAVHSHNDYVQNVPFWKAISVGVNSLEADIFLVGDSLFVAHDTKDIKHNRDLETLYLKPLLQVIELNVLSGKSIQLLVDVKSEAYSTLEVLVSTLEKYPSLISNEQIAIVISGNRPKLEDYINYPEYITFDYQSLDPVPAQKILDKIALLSLNFKKFSDWNGKGRLTTEDFEVVSKTIQIAHNFKKPFRFWGTPDSKTAWKVFAKMGVDYINTDHPIACAQYLNTLVKREYRNTVFSEVYKPTFKSDGEKKSAKNIILLIGDGNGLAQISATALVNKGELSLTQLRNIGILKTQSSDDFTTDSAGGATAMATGQKVPNRAIGVNDNGNPLKNITELLAKNGFVSGIITTDEITGATPAAFYAHQKDRSMTVEIRNDLFKSSLSVFVSIEDPNSEGKNKLGDFEMQASLDEVGLSKEKKVGFLFAKATSPAPLSKAVKNVLAFLDQKRKPFFLMVEGAKIDSYGHENNIGGIINQGIAFDQAISQALRFADANENTLVIVTADHETGGLTIPQGNVLKNEIEGDFTTDDHTGIMVPVFAYGPRSNYFQGTYGNNELFGKMLRAIDVIDQD